MAFRLRLLFFLLPIAGSLRVYAQSSTASPYSRFGLGDLVGNNNAYYVAMGEVSYGLRNPYHVNWTNPASYTAFDSSSFVFEGGFNVDIIKLTSNVQTANMNTASIGYLLYGMPVTKWWRTSLGLLPFSKVGYNIETDQQSDEIGRIVRLYSGDGGINQFLWGNGFRINKNFSVGVNFSYLFGNMDRRATVLFPDSAFYTNYRQDFTLSMHDFYVSYGVQYSTQLDPDHVLTAGGVFAATSKMNGRLDYLARTFLLGSSGVESILDTIAEGTDYKGKIVIPWTAGLGISLVQTDKWLFALDGNWQNWSKFTAFGLSDSLVNSYRVSAGGEILPSNASYGNYFKRLSYRAGFLYSGTYLKLRGRQLSEYSFSLGLGLPLRGVKTTLNLTAVVSVRGTTQADLIRQTMVRFVVGFSLYDKWFVKRKYY
jgi:hypothetical protein